MGSVYRARDERLERDVAVKILLPGLSDASVRRSLVEEARILSRLNHPNIGAVYDIGKAEGRDFIVLEFVPGATLEDLVAAGPLTPAEVARLGLQMARALSAAHAEGVIHRDIKPANLKVTPSGELKLLDFGIAKLVRDPRTLAVTDHTAMGPLGTVPFMSPEQLRGEVVDERSDIFSAGAVLYQMATGRPPFPQRQLGRLIDAVLNQDPARLRVAKPGQYGPLEGVVLRSLQKRPEHRYQSATELAAGLEQALTVLARTRRVAWTKRCWWHLGRALRGTTLSQVRN
jgi:serine/threonine protein kinase